MKRVTWVAAALVLAAVGPNIFPAAEAGHSTLQLLALHLLLPSIGLLATVGLIARRTCPELSRAIWWGAISGALATIPLEIVRLIGFHFDYMPGNLPRLMGVLLLNRFAQGPSTGSDLAGWAYHFWNGASFGIIYTTLFGTRRRWLGALYGLVVGAGFMLSPVVKALGVGYFGLQFSYGFPVTVSLAHLAFGVTLAILTSLLLTNQGSALFPPAVESALSTVNA